MSEVDTAETAEAEDAIDFESILEQVQEEYKDDDSEAEDEDEGSYEEEDDSESEGEVEEDEDSYDSEEEEVDSEEDDSEDDYADDESFDDTDYQTDALEEAPQEEPPQEEVQEVPQQEEVVSEIEQMRQMLYQQQQLINQLQLDKDVPKQEAPQAQPVDPQFAKEAEQLETAFRLQLFGTAADKEDYEGLPKSVKNKAQEALKIHAQEESLNILYPERAYQNKIKFFVQRDIKEALGEIVKERQTNKASELFSKYEDVITTPEQKQRLLKEIRSIPGHKSKDWSVQSRVLDTAVDRVLREQKLSGLVERERDLELREAQIRRTQEARQASTRGKRGRRRSRTKKQQTLKSGDDLLAFARSLEKDIRNAR